MTLEVPEYEKDFYDMLHGQRDLLQLRRELIYRQIEQQIIAVYRQVQQSQGAIVAQIAAKIPPKLPDGSAIIR